MLNLDQNEPPESVTPSSDLKAIGAMLPLLMVGDLYQASYSALAPLLAFLVIIFVGLLIRMVQFRRNLQLRSQDLDKSERHLLIMGDSLPDMAFFQLVHTDAGLFHFTRLSKGFESALGLDRSQIISNAQAAFDHVCKEDIPTLKECMIRGEREKTPANIEVRFVDVHGNIRWYHISAYPHREQGRTIWDGCVQDITELKAIEREAVEENRNLKQQFENIDDFLFVCSPDGGLLHTNPSVENRLGYTSEELMSMRMYELYPQDSRTAVHQAFKRIPSVLSNSCNLPLLSKSGAVVSVEMNFFPGRWEEQKVIFGVGHDVARRMLADNALREAKHMLQLIIDTIPMCVFWKDKDSKYLGCNKAFIVERGVDDIDDVLGKTPFDLFEPSIAQEVIERDQLIVSTNQAVVDQKETYTRTDGNPGWREISKIPLRNAEGKAIGVLGVWRDVTEQNLAEERLKQTLQDMERFNQLMRGRERRTLELKSEINHLLGELGQAAKYQTTSDKLK